MSLFKTKLLILVLICLSTSAIGQNFAKEFLDKQNDSLRQDIIYLYLNPKISYKNENISKISNFNSLNEDLQNELYDKYAPFSSKIQDSTLIINYLKGFIINLQSLGFKVLISNYENLPKDISERIHSISISQLEIDEYNLSDSLKGYGKISKKDIHAIRINSWLIYNEKDSNSRLVFYYDTEVKDFFEGEIVKDGDDYNVSYDYKPINLNDIYKSAFSNGEVSAQYFFNFLMNKYVWIKTSGKDNLFYGIDIKTKQIYYNDEPFDNFDIVDYK